MKEYTDSTKSTNMRDSSFELLRIISMFLIVICHFATHGNFKFDVNTLSVSRFWWYLIEMGGNLGVNVFVLISGYFLIKNEKLFDAKKIMRFWGPIFFYSVLFFIVQLFCGTTFSLVSLAQSLIPITMQTWWFASAYFILFLIHPFINILIKNIDKKTFQALLILLLFIWCIIPTFTLENFGSNSVWWFATLYCIAAYIRIYGLNIKYKKKHYIMAFIVFSLLRYLSSVTLIIIGTRIPYFGTHALAFYGFQSVLTVLSSISLFMIFRSVNIGNKKIINIIASATFGVYLIHDYSFVRNFIWGDLFKNSNYQDSLFLIPYSILCAIIVFCVCTIIELIRKYTIDKIYIALINKLYVVLSKHFYRFYLFVRKVIFG